MRVAIHAFDGVTMFHLAVPLMVFGEIGRLGLAAEWECRLWSDRAGAVRTSEGYLLDGVSGPEATEWADLIVIPSWTHPVAPAGADFARRLRSAHARGAVVAGLCLGAFAVAESGLLEGRAAVTHWESSTTLAERFPGSGVDHSVLYIDHDDVLTSAGTASSIDACLHLVRKHLGSAVGARVARSLVVAPHREGGQAQYVERPLAKAPDDSAMSGVQQWALSRLADDLSIDALASRAGTSRRTFIRQFVRSTGSTPARWIMAQRLDASRVALETTDWSIDDVARRCGFGSTVTFRQNFVEAYGLPPSRHRRQFAHDVVEGGQVKAGQGGEPGPAARSRPDRATRSTTRGA